MTAPNILFLVWDACRLDAAREHAPTLAELADDNLWFERAVTPSGWSLPAQASLLTGESPHEHGVYRVTDRVDSLPPLKRLARAGYTRHCVSANGFLSPTYQFTCGFDEYQSTHEGIAFLDGLDVNEYLSQEKSMNGSATGGASSLLSTVLSHDHPLQSAGNVAAAGLSHLARQYPSLQRLPHRRLSKYGGFCYDPGKNTEAITSVISSAAKREAPFFLVSNYMSTHWPYNPPAQYQREFLGRQCSRSELTELNDHAHAYRYAERVARGDRPDEAAIDAVRGLYRGEVRSADDELRAIIESLKRHDLYEETIVVVTADHGENLGELDELGERSMGHESSASDALLRVPLLIAHPELDGRAVEEWVSTKDVISLLAADRSAFLESGGTDRGPLGSELPVISEYPADGRADELGERYPDIPYRYLTRNLVAAYAGPWKTVASSTGERWAWKSGSERPAEDVPSELLAECSRRLDRFSETSTDAVSSETADRLQQLGYL